MATITWCIRDTSRHTEGCGPRRKLPAAAAAAAAAEARRLRSRSAPEGAAARPEATTTIRRVFRRLTAILLRHSQVINRRRLLVNFS